MARHVINNRASYGTITKMKVLIIRATDDHLGHNKDPDKRLWLQRRQLSNKVPKFAQTSLHKIYTTRTTNITTNIITLFCRPLRSPTQLKAMLRAKILIAFSYKSEYGNPA